MAEDEQITIVGYAIMGIKVRSIFHFIIFVVRAYTTKHQPTFLKLGVICRQQQQQQQHEHPSLCELSYIIIVDDEYDAFFKKNSCWLCSVFF